MSQSLKAAILIVSTSVSQGSTRDFAEQTLRSVFEAEEGRRWEVIDVKVVSDDVAQIQHHVKMWTDDDSVAGGLNLIVTTGGTGFTTADQTPEVFAPEEFEKHVSMW